MIKKTLLMPFNIGCVTPEPIEKNTLEFYSWLVKEIFKEDCSIIKTDNVFSIPIGTETVDLNPDKIFFDFLDVWKNNKADTGFISYVLIDLVNFSKTDVRAGLLINVARAIYSILLHQGKNKSTFIVYLKNLPPKVEAFRSMVSKNSLLSKKVIILDQQGKTVEQDKIIEKIPVDEFKRKLKMIKIDPLEIFKIKLIRRLGHYKRIIGNNHVGCTQYYFDGSLCKIELIKLLDKFIQEKYKNKKCPLIIYNPTISPWLKEILLAFTYERDIGLIDMDKFISNFKNLSSNRILKPIIISPLHQSGKTLHGILEKIMSKKIEINPLLLSILCVGQKDPSIEVNGDIFKVHYFYLVKKINYEIDQCPFCEMGIDFSKNRFEDDYILLTTKDMWYLADEAGWWEEKDVPKEWRESMGEVPNFRKMIDESGSWFVIKLKRILESYYNTAVYSLVIVCPKEKGSEVFTNVLETIFNLNVIKIPRDDVNKFSNDKNDFNKLLSYYKKESPIWYLQLSRIYSNVVIIDEFNASGNTRKGLFRILTGLEKEILCYFTLCDFGLEESKKYQIKCHSLYNFQGYYEELQRKAE